MAFRPPSDSGSQAYTIKQWFQKNGYWIWWEQNGGVGTNPFDGVSEKGIDFSNTFGTQIRVPVGGVIVRIVHNNNAINDVVEMKAADGSVWLYQHIDTRVKVGDKLVCGDLIGVEDGLPVDQYSTGPHIEVRWCPPGKWSPNTDSWDEPWVNPRQYYSTLSSTLAGETGSGNGTVSPSSITNGANRLVSALSPNSNVSQTLYSIDQFMTIKNPFDTSNQGQGTIGDSIPVITGISGASWPDPLKWLGVVGTNLFEDTQAIAVRMVLMVLALFILYKVFTSFVDVSKLTTTALKAGGTLALL